MAETNRRQKRTSLALLLGLLLTSSLATFWLGLNYASPSQQESSQVETLPVWEKVEEGQLTSRISLTAQVQEASSQELRASSTALKPLVTRQNLAAGDKLTSGTLLGMVAGEPVFALAGPLPLYRDLSLGDSGDDVLAFQEALASAGYSTDTQGTVTPRTLEAVTALYRSEKLPLPEEGIQTIKVDSYLSLPVGENIVSRVLSVGGNTAQEALVTVFTSQASLSGQISLEDLQKLEEHAPQLEAQTSAGKTRISSYQLGEFSTSSTGQPQRQISLEVEDAHLLTGQQNVKVQAQDISQSGKILPYAVLREEKGQNYIWKGKDNYRDYRPGEPIENYASKIPVEVLESREGKILIEADIQAQDPVLVAP